MGREGEKVSQQWINRGFVSLSASVWHLSPVFIRKPHMQRSQNCRKFKTQHEKKLNGYENFSETWFPELRCLLLPILLYIWCCSLKYQITQLLTRFSLTFASYSSTKSCFWVQETGKKGFLRAFVSEHTDWPQLHVNHYFLAGHNPSMAFEEGFVIFGGRQIGESLPPTCRQGFSWDLLNLPKGTSRFCFAQCKKCPRNCR